MADEETEEPTEEPTEETEEPTEEPTEETEEPTEETEEPTEELTEETEEPTEEPTEETEEPTEETEESEDIFARMNERIDSLEKSFADFKDQILAMKIEAGAVIEDPGDSVSIDKVYDVPNPYKRDYTI